jgi:hypothetical protein
LQPADPKVFGFLRDTTINVALDGYYAYNFNNPIGRVNLLRAYDVLSNEFSLNQASVVVDHPPDAVAGRRWGGRLDLQFGQATDTLQGNPADEPRPQIYRNIFQAYGTFVSSRLQSQVGIVRDESCRTPPTNASQLCCDDGKIYWGNSTRQGARGVLQDGIGKYGSYWKTAALYRQSLSCV